MRRDMIALGAALILTLTPATAFADYGSFTQDDGPSCTYNGSGSMYNIDCSGYSRSARGYVNYSCEYFFYSGGSAEWNCHDINGARWHGSK